MTYKAKVSWKGSSQVIDLEEEDESSNNHHPTIGEHLKGLDERLEDFKEEIIDNVAKKITNETDYVVSVVEGLKTGELNDRFRTFLYGGALISLIYLHGVSPIFNTSHSVAKGLLGFLPIPQLQLPGKEKANNTNPVASKIDANKLVQAMGKKGYKLRKGPGELNVVYVYNPDFQNTINQWSDRRLLVTFKDNHPIIVHDAPATVKGGKPSWLNPPNPKGYPVVVPGQYLNSWAVGTHKGKPALQQVGPIPVLRTKDQGKTWRRDYGLFGMNQHRGAGNKVKNWSEGCLVSQSGHEKFMKLLYTDPSYKQNNRFRFPTTIISASEL